MGCSSLLTRVFLLTTLLVVLFVLTGLEPASGEVVVSRFLGLDLSGVDLKDTIPGEEEGFTRHPSLLPMEGKGRIFSRLGVEDIIRFRSSDGGEETFVNVRPVTGIFIPFGKGYSSSEILFSYSNTRLLTKYSNEFEEKLSYKGDFSDYLIGYRGEYRSLLNFAGWLKERNIGERWKAQYLGEVYFRPSSSFGLGVRHSQTSFNYILRFSAGDEGGLLPVEGRNSGQSYFFTANWKSQVLLKLDLARTTLDEDEAQMIASDFRMVPSGFFREDVGELIYNSPQNWRLLFLYRQLRLEGGGDLFYLNQKFGKVTQVYLDPKFVKAGFEVERGTHSFHFEYEHSSTSDTTRGHVESWPFTSSLFSLLGSNRTYFRAGGGMRAEKLDFEYYHMLGERQKLGAGISYFHIVPNGALETWEPLLLIFGVKNYKKQVLSIVAADALLVSLGGRRTFGPLVLSGSLSQFLPVRVKKVEAPGKAPPVEAPTRRARTDGGRFYNFEVEYEF